MPKLPLPPLPPIRASCTTFFGRQKRRLAHITEPSNDDYDNDVSDHNFGTFDDFGVKNDQKVSLNMILMSNYKGQHGGKKGQNIRARPPPFNARKKSIFSVRCSLTDIYIYWMILADVGAVMIHLPISR